MKSLAMAFYYHQNLYINFHVLIIQIPWLQGSKKRFFYSAFIQ